MNLADFVVGLRLDPPYPVINVEHDKSMPGAVIMTCLIIVRAGASYF